LVGQICLPLLLRWCLIAVVLHYSTWLIAM
jgi:hypothetical protein